MAFNRAVGVLCAALLLLGVALADKPEESKQVSTATGGCSPAATPTAASAQEQLINLSKLIDPSGRLSNIIVTFGEGQEIRAAGERAKLPSEPVKRSASEPTDSSTTTTTTTSTTTTTTASPAAASSTTPAPSSTTSSAPSSSESPSLAPAASEQVANASSPASSTTTTVQPIKPTTSATQASNVTVNVFLQLVPDAKTEELINNPDKAISSTTSAPAESSSTTPTPAQQPTTAAPSTAAPSTSSTTPAAPVTPTRAARRRRYADAKASLPAAPPSSTTSTTTTTTTTTTAAPVSSTSSTTTSTSTTTTTTAAPPSSTTTSTTVAPSTSAPPKSSSTTPATVEISAKDLPTERKASAGDVQPAATVEIVVSSVASTPPATSTSTTTSTTSTTTPAPSSTSAPVAASTSTAAPTSTSTPSTTTTTTSTTTTPTPSTPKAASVPASTAPGKPLAAAAVAEIAGMLTEDMKEIARIKQTNPVGSAEEQPLVNLEHLTTKVYLTDRDATMQPLEIGAKLNISNVLFGPNNNIDNLNVIYDNDTSLVSFPPSKQEPTQATGSIADRDTSQPIVEVPSKQRSKIGASPTGFVNCDHNEEQESENYATCLFESGKGNSTLVGRLNFWQAINNRGVLHLLARLRYQSSASNSTNSSKHAVGKRESFRTLVEKAPIGGLDESIKRPATAKHQVWVLDSEQLDCSSIGGPLSKNKRLLAELSATSIESPLNLVDIDAELVVGQFNLTGANDIVNRRLVLTSVANGAPIGCCQVTPSDTMPASELDNVPSVSVVQPIREDLLPAAKLPGGEVVAIKQKKKGYA